MIQNMPRLMCATKMGCNVLSGKPIFYLQTLNYLKTYPLWQRYIRVATVCTRLKFTVQRLKLGQ